MAATCTWPECGWTGGPSDVIKANGVCPNCGSEITYVAGGLLKTAIETLEQFNRRAVIGVSGCTRTDWEKGFLDTIRFKVEHYEQLGPAQQRTLFTLVDRYAAQLTDRACVDYCTLHCTPGGGFR